MLEGGITKTVLLETLLLETLVQDSANCLVRVFTCGFSPGLRTQLVQWNNSDYLLFPHKVHQPKSVEARQSKPSSL